MKAAIYSRKSKFTEEGESIENQINMCKNYAENILGITDYEIFEDEGFSGGNINRPNYQKLIIDIRSKKFTHLICYRLDRISRNVADFSSTLEILNKFNVSFISIKEQFDTSTAMGRAMINVSATFAQLERETIAERIKDNLKELSKTGRWLGGPPPLGYESIEIENNDTGKNKKKHILKINENEISIPRKVFELFIKHKSFMKVSRILEEQGIYSRKGSVFSRELVKQTINNPVYAIADKELLNYFKKHGAEVHGYENISVQNGIMPYNRRKDNGSFAPMEDWIISVGEHPGIISSDLWIKCQYINKEIKERASNRECTSQEALLSGLMVCAKCGSGMAPRQNKSGKYIYRYYSCNLRNKAAGRCDNDAVNAYDAEEYVINKLKCTTPEEIIEDFKRIDKNRFTKINNNSLIDDHLKEIDYNKKTISGLVLQTANLGNNPSLLEPFTIEINKLVQRNDDLKFIIENLKEENGELIDNSATLDEILNSFDAFKKLYDYTNNFDEKKRLIQSIVKFITYDHETGILDINIIGTSKERPSSNPLPLSDCSICSNHLKVKNMIVHVPKKAKGFRANQK